MRPQAQSDSPDIAPTQQPAQPWLMRTYAGHSSAAASNALFHKNLAKGQTGLSVAFDLPTQTGHDSDHPLAAGEVGKVGVPICHLGDLRELFDQINVQQSNTSMTINAPAMWLLALYQAVAEEQGADLTQLSGTTQNDVIKEYLSRGTYIFAPEPSMRLTVDVVEYAVKQLPKWNPINICSYHLQEAGATVVQEVAFALGTAMTLLDAMKARGTMTDEEFSQVVGRVSFFVNSGVRFVEEMCKMRAFVELWEEITTTRYGITNPKHRRFRYGVQVNSLGLTEQQPENNIQRIVLELLGVTLSKKARARAVQLPAWNEALGLPRPWDQQWSLRIQQVLAHESDLLEYPDLFDGSPVVAQKVAEIISGVRAELADIEQAGGVLAAVDAGYLKAKLVTAQAQARTDLESGARTIVGVNEFTTTEPNPLTAAGHSATQTVDHGAEQEAIDRVQRWRQERDQDPNRAAAHQDALAQLARTAADPTQNLMAASLVCAKAGVTTGEWADTLREVFGSYRAATGVGQQAAAAQPHDTLREVQERVRETGAQLGRPLRLLVGKPGLDGHSNGAEQVAVRARDAGFEVVYQGIRLTSADIVSAAISEDVHCVGLSILSGSHLTLVPQVVAGLAAAGAADIPVVVGGIISPADEDVLLAQGVRAVFTPKDYSLTDSIVQIVQVIRAQHGLDLPVQPSA